MVLLQSSLQLHKFCPYLHFFICTAMSTQWRSQGFQSGGVKGEGTGGGAPPPAGGPGALPLENFSNYRCT
jgi:hypothetical protein